MSVKVFFYFHFHIWTLTKKTPNLENYISVENQDFLKCRLLLKILWILCSHFMRSGDLKIILVRRYLSFSMLSRYTCVLIFDAIEKKILWKKSVFCSMHSYSIYNPFDLKRIWSKIIWPTWTLICVYCTQVRKTLHTHLKTWRKSFL